MGLLDRIFGTPSPKHGTPGRPPPGSDTYALERYRYMLQTAPPETIEQAHAEAFEQLTPEQRQEVLATLARSAPSHERGAIERTPADDPRALARAATRAELRQPGLMERTLGASPTAGFGAGLLGSFAAAFAGSVVANAFFASLGGFDGFGEDAGQDAAADDAEPGANAEDGQGAADDGGSLAGVGDVDADGSDFDGGDFDV